MRPTSHTHTHTHTHHISFVPQASRHKSSAPDTRAPTSKWHPTWVRLLAESAILYYLERIHEFVIMLRINIHSKEGKKEGVRKKNHNSITCNTFSVKEYYQQFYGLFRRDS